MAKKGGIAPCVEEILLWLVENGFEWDRETTFATFFVRDGVAVGVGPQSAKVRVVYTRSKHMCWKDLDGLKQMAKEAGW